MVDPLNSDSQDLQIPCVTADQLLAAEREVAYRIQLERTEVFPSEANWAYITEHAMRGLAPLLYDKYMLAWITAPKERSDLHELALTEFPHYLDALPRSVAIKTVFADLESAPEAAIHIVHQCQLFDAPTLNQILGQAATPHLRSMVCAMLDALQPQYTHADMTSMRTLLKKLENLPALGEMREVRAIFGRDLRYICPNGHSNSPRHEHCTSCYLNIEGLTPEDVENIEHYSNRISLLDKMLPR